jgi:RNA polymerase sigma factor (sigma-70 family)
MAQSAADHELLRRYARDRDEPAFADLTRRYVALVYSSAVRRVGDRHMAYDITQAVFMILSRKAGSIPADKPLSLWLLNATRYAAANALKIESRRRRHEDAVATSAAAGVCSADPAAALLWQEVASELDDAVLKLPSLDRRVVLLRYFEDRPIRDIALELNTTEGAVKQRLSRAVEKLRSHLDRAAGGGAMAAISVARFETLLASHAVLPAPMGTVAAAVSISSIVATSSLTHSIAKGAMNMMTWTKAKVAASIVAAVMLGGAGGFITLGRALAEDTKTPAAQPGKPAPKAQAKPKANDDKPKKADNYLGIVTVADAPPVVVETFPKSGASDVDPATTELKVMFSKEMQDGSWSWAQISDSTFPNVTAKPHYDGDRRTCVLPVKLEPNHTYVIQLNYPPFDNFIDTDGRKAVRYLFVFQTRG